MFYLFVVPSSESSYAGTININDQKNVNVNLLMKQNILEKSVEEFLNRSANARLKGLIEDLGKAAQQPTSPSVEISNPEVAEALKEHVTTMNIEDQKLLSSFADHFGFSSLESICHEFDGSSKGMHYYQGHQKYMGGAKGDLQSLESLKAAKILAAASIVYVAKFAMRGDPFSCPKKGTYLHRHNLAYQFGFFQDEKESPLKDFDSYRLGIELD
ncbi:MAG: hypothetical protein P8R31_00115 [Mariniblastus sp.]|nr:hypothetical protein [Mariniblastus sp.]